MPNEVIRIEIEIPVDGVRGAISEISALIDKVSPLLDKADKVQSIIGLFVKKKKTDEAKT